MGKGIMFLMFVWLMTCIAGGVVQGSTVITATTALTADITDTDTSIPVTSTTGFPESGFIEILDERIGYSSTTANTFDGSVAQPMIRGATDTEAADHSAGELARTVESSMLNQSFGYKLAVLSDASGLLAFVTIPFNFITLLASFFVLPLSFLGGDLEILTYIWGIFGIGMLVAIGIALAGGRRV